MKLLYPRSRCASAAMRGCTLCVSVFLGAFTHRTEHTNECASAILSACARCVFVHHEQLCTHPATSKLLLSQAIAHTVLTCKHACVIVSGWVIEGLESESAAQYALVRKMYVGYDGCREVLLGSHWFMIEANVQTGLRTHVLQTRRAQIQCSRPTHCCSC